MLIVLLATHSIAYAHDGDLHLSGDGGSEEVQDSAETNDETHQAIDEAPTVSEEAALIEQAEAEKIGHNPDESDESARAATANEHITGSWGPVENWPVIGVHVSLLTDGRVLAYDSINDDPTEASQSHTFTRATVWDPKTNFHTDVEADQGHNIFCSGFASLPDGRLYIAGGNLNAALQGIDKTHIFNPLNNSWSLGPDMKSARWYPSVTPLPNGEMLITGGGPAISEVRLNNGTTRELTNASQSVWANRNYPWLQTAPDGRVAFFGPANQMGYVTTAGTGSWQSTVLRDNVWRGYGSYAMYDVGKVLIAGGGNQSANHDQRSSLIVDLSNDTVTATDNMANRRRQHNLTVLADGTVLATGGFASNNGLVDLNTSVFDAEIWNPATGQWTTVSAESRARQYHSTALLLPDGRVLSSGGGICGACQAAGYIQKNAQIFSPPYLFNPDGSGQLAIRPVIASAPDAVRYNAPLTVESPQAGSITKAAFVRVGSVTHAQNMEQRYVPATFSVQNGNLQIDAPTNANIAPPGTYMLFIIDSAGVPSEAAFVNIQASNNQAPYAVATASPTVGSAPLSVSFNSSGSYDNDGSIASRSWTFGDGSSSNATNPSYVYTTPGTYTAQLTITDNNGATDVTSIEIMVGQAASCDTAGLLFQSWDGIQGVAISDLTSNVNYPQNPSSSSLLTSFEIPTNVKENYGVRLRGYIKPTVSGSYTFWIASDDNGELWLSSDSNAGNAVQIANVPTWTSSRQFDKFGSQQSAPVSLVAGQLYYVEALMKEWGGGDNLAVAWQRSGTSRSVIGSNNLCAFELAGSAPNAVIAANPTSGTAPLTVNFNGNGSSDSDGNIVTYQWDFGNGISASGSTVSTTFNQSGVYTVELTVTDNDGRSDSATTNITVNGSGSCSASGLLHERWTGLPGVAIADLTSSPNYPDSPNFTGVVSDFETPTNILENYGVRVSGYIDAPVTGNYTFWIASDDNGELWLSSDENAANKQLIANVPAWAPSRQWDWYTEQQSAPINLVAGQRYYVEALMKEFGGGDNLSVAWQTPGGTRTLVPNVVLCQPETDTNARPTAVINATPLSGDAPLLVNFNGSGSSDDGSIVSYAWVFGDGNSANGVNRNHTYANPGVYTARLTVTDDGGKTDSTTVTISVTQPGGDPSCNTSGVTREVWNNIWNGNVAALTSDARYPDSPTSSDTLTGFVAPSNVGNGYGARMQAYIVAPETGVYTFWVASDNGSELWLSSDSNPGNAAQIASTSWSPEQGWDFSSSQQSAQINLIGGEYYYIEGLHYASWGGDYFAVAWDTPSGSRQVIPEVSLCAFVDDGGRSAENARTTGNSLLMQSVLAQSLPLELYDDVLLVLMSDQPLREALLALRDDTVALLDENSVVSAEFLQRVDDLFAQFYASASPELKAWIDANWSHADINQYENDAAVDAWRDINSASVPTAVSLTNTPAASSTWQILALAVFMLFMTGGWYLTRRNQV